MSDSVEIKGTVHLVEETKEYGQKGFTKRMMVIETDSKFNNLIAVEAVKDKCEMFDGLTEGDEVTAHVNIDGRAWNDRFFVSLNCWRVEQGASKPSHSPAEGNTTSEAGTGSSDGANASEGTPEDSIPF
jgi:hypothetical protein